MIFMKKRIDRKHFINTKMIDFLIFKFDLKFKKYIFFVKQTNCSNEL